MEDKRNRSLPPRHEVVNAVRGTDTHGKRKAAAPAKGDREDKVPSGQFVPPLLNKMKEMENDMAGIRQKIAQLQAQLEQKEGEHAAYKYSVEQQQNQFHGLRVEMFEYNDSAIRALTSFRSYKQFVAFHNSISLCDELKARVEKEKAEAEGEAFKGRPSTLSSMNCLFLLYFIKSPTSGSMSSVSSAVRGLLGFSMENSPFGR
jgi:hypothetical protein